MPPPFVPPYAPSWVDRFTDWVDRLPGPPWAYYLAWAVVFFLLITGVQWSAGTYPVGTLKGSHAIAAFITPYAIGLIHYLDRIAGPAMQVFRPAMRGDESLHQHLTYVLTTLPPRSALTAGLALLIAGMIVAAGAAFLQPSAAAGSDAWMRLEVGFRILFEVGATPASYIVTLGFLVLNWWVGGTLVLHTVRRLSLVPRIYRRHTNVDLFRQGPLYALSRLTAQTMIGDLILLYALASVRTYISQPLGGGTITVFTTLALASFALPLVGVHRVLAGEKERLLEGIADRLHDAGQELHRRIQAGRYRGMDELNKALAGLEIQRNMIAAIPTWPWHPETLRTLLAALLLPLIVWLIQSVLQRLLG